MGSALGFLYDLPIEPSPGETLRKLTLVFPYVIWVAACSRSRPKEAPVTKPFRIGMMVLGFYFAFISLLSETQHRHGYSSRNPTLYMTIAVLAYLSVQKPMVPTIVVEAIMFMLLYNMRNTVVNFFGLGAPECDSMKSLVDGCVTWPIACCTMHQYMRMPRNVPKYM
eukprot:FR738283.1.p1 GENE.FR738283.1~~FR738283.1.p1  ORF type:complete len:167 (+),score=16.37 FR738283.1:291-791(+)